MLALPGIQYRRYTSSVHTDMHRAGTCAGEAAAGHIYSAPDERTLAPAKAEQPACCEREPTDPRSAAPRQGGPGDHGLAAHKQGG